MIKNFFFSIMASIIFGLIDASFTFLGATSIYNILIKYMVKDIAELLTSGISAAVAIFIATLVRNLLKKYSDFDETAWIESSGIIIGTMIFILFYYLLRHIKRKFI